MHMVNVVCLVLCLQLWLATSYSKITTVRMDNVVACEGGTGEFPWTNDTRPLIEVEYYFQNKIITKPSSNFTSGVYKDENLKWRLLKDDNVSIRIETVTEKDRGEYKIVFTYNDGDELELVGSLDVTVPGRGKLNITRETNNQTTSFRCGEKTGSDLYSWVFTNATGEADKKTEESELTLDVLPRHGSFYCVRLSDCQRSPCFNFTSEIELGDYTITVTNTTEDCRTLKCGEPVGTNTTYEWSSKVDCKAEERNRTTTNTFELCLNNFNYSVKCQRDHDCTETPWQRFGPGQSERHRRERRTLGNLDDSSPITTGIVVTVVFAVIAGIAVLTVVTLRKLKSRQKVKSRRPDKGKTTTSTECHELVDKTHQPEEKRHDELEELKDSKHLQDKETCEQVNLKKTT